uniref:Uncharacterized protein n=1 Tax=Sphaerodactylus townsendi TaxID=933632 RepID=A0ACB8FCC6_9SAUR
MKATAEEDGVKGLDCPTLGVSQFYCRQHLKIPSGVGRAMMFDWITHNKGLFLNSYTEIGASHPHAMELQTQHNHFAMNCMHGLQIQMDPN